MKVVFITPVTPYRENMGGPSGHPYHLMKERPQGVDITIYSFNNNHLSENVIRSVEEELRVKIHLLQQPKWWQLILKLHLAFIRILLKYPINYYIRLGKKHVEEIKSLQPDIVWGYGQEFSGILKQFKEHRRLHTVPDSYSLHFYRRLGKRQTFSSIKEYWRVVLNYIKYYRMEREYDDSDNIEYHLVGEEDKNFLLELNPKLHAHFIRHPHYEINEARGESKEERVFHSPKIKLLIAGRYDLYSIQAADELLYYIKGNANNLNDHYVFTFLGKGWEKHVEALLETGLEVNHIKFAPDYIEEITKHDIQINPLSIGTGTKGKVLDALANGLLVIGSHYAMENIAGTSGVDFIEYHDAAEVVETLKDIADNDNRRRYEAMARHGQETVLREHNRAKVAAELFALVRKEN